MYRSCVDAQLKELNERKAAIMADIKSLNSTKTQTAADIETLSKKMGAEEILIEQLRSELHEVWVGTEAARNKFGWRRGHDR